MFGVLALVVTAGVCAGIIGVDSYRKQEYEAKQKNAEEQWKKAYNSFFRKATNRSMESDYEQKLRRIMLGSKEYPEIVDEIKTTYQKWINDDPYYIKYLGTSGSLASGSVYDYVLDVLLIVLMANRGYITTGAAIGGIDYNSVCPPSQATYLARRLNEMLQKKGIHEDLYFKQTLGDPQKLSYSSQMGYTGCIFWKPKEPMLYY
jgi:hypothetical protein